MQMTLRHVFCFMEFAFGMKILDFIDSISWHLCPIQMSSETGSSGVEDVIYCIK